MRFIDKDKDKHSGLVGVESEGDELVFTHAYDTDPIMKELKWRKENQRDNGWSEKRTMRYLGTIPAEVTVIEPHLQEDAKAAAAWFDTPVGQQFRVNKADTGRSGKIIVK